jgi:hypothetical protein
MFLRLGSARKANMTFAAFQLCLPGCCAQDAAPGTALPGPVRRRATKYKWTVDESIATINLIKSTVDVEDVNVDLHKLLAAAIAEGHFTSHNMRESE